MVTSTNPSLSSHNHLVKLLLGVDAKIELKLTYLLSDGRSSNLEVSARECFIEDVMEIRTDSTPKMSAGKPVLPLGDKCK
ncbi:hypothetical protein Y032_0039g66 [Ancylostoma ceylanicum]|uniref:Uncharacterized protein n=1 Tax=Ancylostoma ceylanicum TaxID=53326 RepID=A0A016UK34_9BILA|nr:hypothetical protein Y032_0039g66 [Ancylostoma ceylanicum]